jgi:transposase
VEIADQVENFFGAAAEPDLVFVAVLARHVDGRSPSVGGSAVAQPHQRHLFPVGQFAGYVGELAPEAHVNLGQLRPAGLGVGAKPLGQGGLGRLGDDGHALHIAGPACRSPSPGRFPGRLGEPATFFPESSPVPAPRARQIILTAAERRRLGKLACSRTAGYQQVIRARIVLDAARGCSNAEISRRHGVVADTVRLWRGRYADEGMAGLADRRRSGRPPRFTPVQSAEVKALACQLPAETGVPLSRWSCPDLAGEITGRGIAPAMSASTVRRILAADTIKPWQYQSWLFIRDPDFAAKATRVLDLYARVFDGSPLGDGEYVISSDEKTSIQARCRCHPALPPGRSRAMRVNHEYDRGGALAYLAAYDVHRARVIGLCSDTTGIEPFTDLVDEVMTQEPYASARRVFWVVDNGSSHRGQAASDRLTARYPNAVMIHTPVHASWLNQVEVFFSIVQRKVVSPRLHRPRPGPRPAHCLRAALQRHRPAVQMEVHPCRPRRPTGPDRTARTERAKPAARTRPPACRTGSLMTPEELPAQTTKRRPL